MNNTHTEPTTAEALFSNRQAGGWMRNLLLVIACAASAASAASCLHAQAISTSLADQMNLATSIAVDNAGNTYFPDTLQDAILKISRSGNQSEVVCCTVGANHLQTPRGVAMDASQNLYIADTGNNRVVEVTSGGADVLLDPGGFLLNNPSGIAADSVGDLYIADSGNNRIIEVVSGGGVTLVSTPGYQLSSPQGVSIDSTGNLYVADTGNQRVVVIHGSTISSLQSSASPSPLIIAADQSGNTYVGQVGTPIQGGFTSQPLPTFIAAASLWAKMSTTNMTLNSGDGLSSSLTITLTPQNGFTRPLTLGCLGLPSGSTASFSPSTVSFTGNTPVVVTLSMNRSASAPATPLAKLLGGPLATSKNKGGRGLAIAAATPLALMFLIGFRKAGKNFTYAGKISAIVAIAIISAASSPFLVGCAGGQPAYFNSYSAMVVATPSGGNATIPLGSFQVSTQ